MTFMKDLLEKLSKLKASLLRTTNELKKFEKAPPKFAKVTTENPKLSQLKHEILQDEEILTLKERSIKTIQKKYKEAMEREIATLKKSIERKKHELDRILATITPQPSPTKPETLDPEEQSSLKDRTITLEEEIREVESQLPKDLSREFKIAFQTNPMSPLTFVKPKERKCATCGVILSFPVFANFMDKGKPTRCTGCNRLIVGIIEV